MMSRYSEVVPPAVITFLKEFAASIESGNLQDIMENYGEKWEDINKQYHRTTSWPSAKTIQAQLQLKGEFKGLFMCLYKQLFFRHIFQRLEPAEPQGKDGDPHRYMQQYLDSFQNFVDLFNILINIWRKQDTALKAFDMPNKWLWDIIHSFVSQCQAFHLWKSKLDHQDTPELPAEQQQILLDHSEKAWPLCAVFRYLSIFAWYANIPVRLGLTPKQDDNQERNDMQEVLGQYSIIGMLRLHTILGDYTTALEVLESIELRTNNAVTSFWSCDLTICYHMAVCYMMKGRFQDVLAIVPEVRAKHGTLFELNEQNLSNRLQSWFNRLKHMELICKYMCWSQDSSVLMVENIHASARDMIMDEWSKAQPDFVSPKPPSLTESNHNYVAQAQQNAFELLVQPRFELDHVRESLTVYRSVGVNVLSEDIENFSEKLLLRYKLATRQIQKTPESLPHQGKWMCACDSDFFLKDNFLESREIQPDISYAEDLSKLILHVSRFGRTLE